MEISKADQIRELRAAGLTVREIAVRVGCSHQYAARICQQQGRPALTVTLDDQGRAVVSGELAPKLLATHVVRALQRSAYVTYSPGQSV